MQVVLQFETCNSHQFTMSTAGFKGFQDVSVVESGQNPITRPWLETKVSRSAMSLQRISGALCNWNKNGEIGHCNAEVRLYYDIIFPIHMICNVRLYYNVGYTMILYTVVQKMFLVMIL